MGDAGSWGPPWDANSWEACAVLSYDVYTDPYIRRRIMQQKIQVLVVGAGLAGLTAALLLAWRGVSCVLVERRQTTSRHPRARGVNFRTMELLRGVPGLEQALANAAPTRTGFSIVIAES